MHFLWPVPGFSSSAACFYCIATPIGCLDVLKEMAAGCARVVYAVFVFGPGCGRFIFTTVSQFEKRLLGHISISLSLCLLSLCLSVFLPASPSVCLPVFVSFCLYLCLYCLVSMDSRSCRWGQLVCLTNFRTRCSCLWSGMWPFHFYHSQPV